MPDFTLSTYKALLQSLLNADYKFQTFADFLKSPEEKTVILRHDVDALPGNSLKTAQLEHELGIRGTYYFRIVSESNHPNIIRAIAKLGHEIGYHYEDLSLVAKNFRRQVRWGDREKRGEGEIYEMAIKSFEKNLEYFRLYFPVETICMHGSPLSRYDNRQVWEKYNYRDFGVTGEPYFDIDFSKVLYLTDTGRCWNGEKFSIRDKVSTHNPPTPAKATTDDAQPSQQSQPSQQPQPSQPLHSTCDIIAVAKNRNLPNQLMITVHPQRWTNNPLRWTRELVMQNLKNVVKRFVVK